MSDPQVVGKVHLIEETKSYGQKGFRKRLVVLEQDKGKFPNYVPIEFTNDNCDKADDLAVGQEVVVSYRLNGRKWQRDPDSEVKFFVNLEALSVSAKEGSSAPAKSKNATTNAFDDANNELTYSEEDIPF
jgi:Domain of unknown function (DUF3127)